MGESDLKKMVILTPVMVLVVVLGFMGTKIFLIKDTPSYQDQAIGTVAFSMGLIALVMLVVTLPSYLLSIRKDLIKRREEEEEFVENFGFPSKGTGESVERNQLIVDQVLACRAMELKAVCDLETQELGRILSKGLAEGNLPLFQRLAEAIREEISKAKKRFWGPHTLAKRKGFEVRERYSDYFPKVRENILGR